MKVKTQDLTGPALDWAAAVAEGRKPAFWPAPKGVRLKPTVQVFHPNTEWGPYTPSTDPAQGQPILERERMYFSAPGPNGEGGWTATRFRDRRHEGFGPTMLIAGMRCFVASKLGDEVDVPDDLVKDRHDPGST